MSFEPVLIRRGNETGSRWWLVAVRDSTGTCYHVYDTPWRRGAPTDVKVDFDPFDGEVVAGPEATAAYVAYRMGARARCELIDRTRVICEV